MTKSNSSTSIEKIKTLQAQSL